MQQLAWVEIIARIGRKSELPDGRKYGLVRITFLTQRISKHTMADQNAIVNGYNYKGVAWSSQK